ncbi:family 43 glycosylhydrolase [Sphingomonas arantia]|uniref:Family 43 glycosylhydrolase n=1 Tax=Sphingomonas arantia TaxID=1460676 RepID=A0ABW4TVM8_9SPHN
MMIAVSRRLFVAGAGAVSASGAIARLPGGAPAAAPVPSNPVVRQRADAQVFRHDDGYYYMTGSVPEYDRIVLRRSRTLAGLTTAPERVLWRHLASGPMSGFLWAPELHLIDGKWIVYFAAGPSGGGEDVFRIRTYALVADGADPMTARWSVLGQLKTPWDSFNLDSTSFVHRGTRYLCWAQREPGIETNSNLYLAPLATPLTLAKPPIRLAVPTLDWEIQGYKVAEAPSLLARNGRLFITYSASATDARYCLGMVSARADADIMNAASWTKSPLPVFVSSTVTNVYGPGHNSFTVDEQGRDVLVYHGRDYAAIKGDPLFDPNRHTRMQRFYYKPDGTPDFGIPVGNGPLPDRFAAVGGDAGFLRHDGDRVSVGQGDIASSQFRRVPGIAGRGSVSLVPIDAPDRYLFAQGDGQIALAAKDGGRGFAEQASFIARPGLTDPGGITFVAAGRPGMAVRRGDGALMLGTTATPAERASATFLVR